MRLPLGVDEMGLFREEKNDVVRFCNLCYCYDPQVEEFECNAKD